MGQKLGQDSEITTVIINNSRLKILYMDSYDKNIRMTIGGQQYKIQKDIECDLNKQGPNGLDINALKKNEKYYLYGILNNNSVSVIASLNKPNIGPTNYNTYKLLTTFTTKSDKAEIDAIGE